MKMPLNGVLFNNVIFLHKFQISNKNISNEQKNKSQTCASFNRFIDVYIKWLKGFKDFLRIM